MVSTLERISRALSAVGAPAADVVLGIVDGVPDLSLAIFDGSHIDIEHSMLPESAIEADAHGTEICSLIFSSVSGLAHGSTGLVLPVFFGTAPSPTAMRASQMDVARALYMAVERRVSIVNVSAGQKSATAEAGRHLEDAIDLCHRRRIMVVAAAGNDGCACLHVPAAVPTVLAVGAMDANARPIAQSNWGESYAANGILAPGTDLDVTSVGGAQKRKSGTSYATAVVSAVAARLLSAARRASYDLDAIDIRSILVDSADPCDESVDGECARILAGKLNVTSAIELLHQRGRSGIGRSSLGFRHRLQPTGRGGLIMNSGSVETAAVGVSTIENPFPTMGEVQQSSCSCGGSGTCSCGKTNKDAEAEQQSVAASSLSSDKSATAPQVTQQACSCDDKQAPQIVYSIGALWFDFGNEARYDAIVQQMNDPVGANNPPVLLNFLSENLSFASGITFILMQDQIPVYAIQPAGPFALDIYRAMLEAMQTSLDTTGDLQRVAIPGLVAGTTRLMNGMTLPVVYPDLRGMVKWRAGELAAAAKAAVGEDQIAEGSISNSLMRVYDELRNFGISPEDRAMNFAATNAYQAATAFADGASRRLELYRIGVKKSPICRPDSDCWDVQLVMFDPENDRRAARFYRFTVDVSEVLPVTVGVMRTWSAPLGGV